MEYFRSAASAFLAKASPLPNHTIGERDNWFEGRTIWSLHKGVSREDGSDCSILIFDATQPAHNPRRSSLPLAKNALRKLRTTRHPDVVKLLDSAETPTAVYIAIESVKPLGRALEEMKAKANQKDEWVGWGVSKIASAIKFLNADAASTHGTIRMDSIFMAASGEWRLGGFELTTCAQEDAPTLYNYGTLVPDANRYAPPEVKQQGWNSLRDLEAHSLDSYMFALFIIEAYNGSLPPTISAVPNQGRVPSAIYQLVRRMMVPNAKNRLPTAQLLAAGQAEGGFFAENRLFKVASGLDGFVLAREEDRMEIMRQLKSNSDSFPPEFLQYKVLPALVNALNLATTTSQQPAILSSTMQANRILPLVLQLGATLPDKEWKHSVAPPILKAYTSADRAVRMTLLENLSLYCDRLEARTISDKIWPNLQTGFGDSAAVIREATVKAILPLSSKLTDRILNNELLRQLARTQVDVEAGIRTNTTILLGSLAPKLSLQTRKKVLVPAFSRSLKDPFVHARNAGLMALTATSESFDGEDSARLIIPAISPCLIDKEKMVRDQAKSSLDIFLAKVQDMADQLPETLEEGESGTSSLLGQNGSQNIIASTAGGAASALASWTLSQLSKPIDTSTLPSRSEMTNAATRADILSEAQAPLSRSTASPVSVSSSRDSIPSSSFADPPAPAWSKQGDLMDVNDDDDDWSGFETAPIKTAAIKSKRTPLGVRTGNGRSASKDSTASVRGSLQRATLGDAKSAMMRKSLAVADVADDDAWGDDAGSLSLSPTAAGKSSNREKEERSPLPSRSESPASAFAKAPAWEEGAAATNTGAAELWGAIDEGQDDSEDKKVASAGAAINSLSKEEKRAEMERKREERRQRMAQLKESKAAKLASGLA